jgi:hypothetical protein
MCAFGGSFAEMRQHDAMRAVHGPALGYVYVMVVSTAGSAGRVERLAKEQLFVASIDVTL